MTLNALKSNKVKKWISFQSKYAYLFKRYIIFKGGGGSLVYELLETDGAQGNYKI